MSATKRQKVEQAVIEAIEAIGGQAVLVGSDDEPVASVPYGRTGWYDVYVREAKP